MGKDRKIGLSSLGGLVYSTNPESMKVEEQEAIETIDKKEQKLRVVLDRKHRAGKIVTLIEGFYGNDDDFQALAKQLKTKCGTGGSAKEGLIIIQGDYKLKITAWLKDWGYTKTKAV